MAGDPFCFKHGYLPCSCSQVPGGTWFNGVSYFTQTQFPNQINVKIINHSEEENKSFDAMVSVIEDLIRQGLDETQHWRSMKNTISPDGNFVYENPNKQMVEFVLQNQEELFRRLGKSVRVKDLLQQLLEVFQEEKE